MRWKGFDYREDCWEPCSNIEASLIDQFEQCSLPRLELPARAEVRRPDWSLTLTLTLTGRPPTLPQPSAQVWLIDEVLETKGARARVRWLGYAHRQRLDAERPHRIACE